MSSDSTERIDAMAEVSVRWGITVNEADAFLESVGFVEDADKWCPSCFRPLDDTDGEPLSAYGKTYCRGCGAALFDNVKERNSREVNTDIDNEEE